MKWMMVATLVAGALVSAPAVEAAPRRAQPGPDVAVGHDGTLFVSSPRDGRVLAVGPGGAEVMVDGATAPGPLVLYGGRLIVGSGDGLYALDLKSRAFTPMADVGVVVGLAVDHVGWFVVRTAAPARLLRVTPAGEVTRLRVAVRGAGPIAFDAASRRLTLDGREHDYLRIVGDDPDVWAARDARPMQPFEENGVILSGAEYWPNRGDTPTRYPEDVLWGFYPEAGVVFEGEAAAATPTDAAMACARTAYDRLRAWAAEPPAAFHEAARRVGSNRVYLWVNDYSQASEPFPHPMRMNGFWYWERKPAVIGRVRGYWKWESTVTQSGECLTPTDDQIGAALEKVLR